MIDRAHFASFHPFARLTRLLDGVPPGEPEIDVAGHPAGTPVFLCKGEPQDQPPSWVADELTKAAAGWSRYPPPRGVPDYLDACAAWLARRYDLPEGMIDPKRMLLPVSGSREGLFFAAHAVAAAKPRPLVLTPNPYYHVYPAAALSAGAEPVFVAATEETGFLPDYESLPAEVLDRTTLAYYCSPSNPQGAAADLEQLQALITLARRHDFTIAFDECYAELYTGAPPAGALQAAAALGGGLDNVLVFHSLSKRSSAAGLRCAFAVGAPPAIDALESLLRVGGSGVPVPVMAAGARLWREDSHAADRRARYRENYAIAERVIGNRFGFRKPAGGFFLWLDVGDGEAAARKLWRQAGIRVVPGAYMCEDGAEGANPGAPYIRVALVYDHPLTEAALRRVADVL